MLGRDDGAEAGSNLRGSDVEVPWRLPWVYFDTGFKCRLEFEWGQGYLRHGNLSRERARPSDEGQARWEVHKLNYRMLKQ